MRRKPKSINRSVLYRQKDYRRYGVLFKIRGISRVYLLLLLISRRQVALNVSSGGVFLFAERTCKSRILWYNHDTLEWDMISVLGVAERPDPCFRPMLEPGQEIICRERKPPSIGGWLEDREWKTSWKPGQRSLRKSESKVVLNVL